MMSPPAATRAGGGGTVLVTVGRQVGFVDADRFPARAVGLVDLRTGLAGPAAAAVGGTAVVTAAMTSELSPTSARLNGRSTRFTPNAGDCESTRRVRSPTGSPQE
jgi:hypothetical protein